MGWWVALSEALHAKVFVRPSLLVGYDGTDA